MNHIGTQAPAQVMHLEPWRMGPQVTAHMGWLADIIKLDLIGLGWNWNHWLTHQIELSEDFKWVDIQTSLPFWSFSWNCVSSTLNKQFCTIPSAALSITTIFFTPTHPYSHLSNLSIDSYLFIFLIIFTPDDDSLTLCKLIPVTYSP